jgi:hypothetical protein
MPNLAVSDIRVFGNGGGNTPETPKNLEAKRDTDERNAFIKWEKVEGAVGYNILWGIAPDKLYQTYQIWADEPSEKEIRALNVGVKYYFAIEAFNENGVSKVSEVLGGI